MKNTALWLMLACATGLTGCTSPLTVQDLRHATTLTLNPGNASARVIEGEALRDYLDSFEEDSSNLGGTSHRAVPGSIQIAEKTYPLLYAEERVEPHAAIIWIESDAAILKIRQVITPNTADAIDAP